MKCKKLFYGILSVALVCMGFVLVACSEKQPSGDAWTIERVYEAARESGYEGSLEDLIAMFGGFEIKSVRVDERGHLIITLTNGTVLDAGSVSGGSNSGSNNGSSSGSNSGDVGDFTEGLSYLETRHPVTGEKAYEVRGMGSFYGVEIVIPPTYKGCPVISISSSAFKDQTYLKSVTIPDSILTIGGSAFSGCRGLTNVTIGDSVTSIGNNAFRNCNSLTNVTIGDSVTSIGDGAFENCGSLTDVTIGNSVTSIGDWAFENCGSLTDVTIGNSVTSIGNNAFKNCGSLTEIVIPDSVTSIGSYAFDGCSNLTSVFFQNPKGWKAWYLIMWIKIPSDELSDPAMAAEYFKSKYFERCKYSEVDWERADD